MANIKVAVRVRPISQREINVTGADVVVHTDSREISLTNLKVPSSKAGDSRERTRRYTFDYCFDSSDSSADNYAGQEKIYETIGNSVLDGIFDGYNSCLVAYGQSASGKTYTMMGTKEDPGLIPRICRGIFSRISQRNEINEESFRINVSYLEVYNERVRDLLKPSTSSNGLRVREHPRLGPYVQGLTQHQVETLGSLMFRVEEGTKARKTASTLQNPSSSRSHALLTLTLEPNTSSTTGNVASLQTTKASVRNSDFNKGSKLHLVDLAGSENAAACPGINRLKEGANINKSLVALGNVISALAERGSGGSNPGRRFIPYRDSALTWLLKDSLGGNATTIMLATISPASGSFNETSHTLRFAQRAQSVINRPVINEDPVAKIIRELRTEVARLKSLLLEKNIEPTSDLKPLPCVCKHNQERQDFQTRCVSTSTSNSPTPDSVSSSVSLTRRHSTSDCTIPKYITNESQVHFGSLEAIGNDSDCNPQFPNYNCARISQLTEEINAPVFVDIPTLVAVLIKPDSNAAASPTSHQIEEIPNDSTDPIDNVPSTNSIENCTESPEEVKNISSPLKNVDPVPSFHIIDNLIQNVTVRPRLRKQQSTDSNLLPVSASVLTATKRYGSSEAIGKRTQQPPAVLSRSQTTLEKRVNSDKSKKLNNIREIEDKSDKPNDSLNDKSPTKRSPARKHSIDIFKRRTSKDSSSSSSKDDSTNSTKDSRKNSADSEQLPSKPHTVIQRPRRADIVAAVTERLYSSRKTSEESNTASTPASDIRSPENTEVKLASTTRMRLQEISRKMLAKRRRICVDTQTDVLSTVRVKDKSINVREAKPLRKDASVLTERHENYQLLTPSDKVVVRVKEMSTSTSDAPDKPLVYFKDAANITEHCSDHYDSMELCQHDSGIVYDDVRYNGHVEVSESSMNTNLPIQPSSSASQTSRDDTRTCCDDKHHLKPKLLHACQEDDHDKCNDVSSVHKHKHNHKNDHNHLHQSHLPIVEPCCTDIHDSHKQDDCEKSKIHINLPDMINITIESPNVLESKIQVYDTKNLRDTLIKKKDTETQTDKKDGLEIGTLTDENLTRLRTRDLSTTTATRPSQTDGRTFRIENIFQDPNCHTRNNSTSIDVLSGIPSNCYHQKNSIVFTNSIGTSSTMRSGDNENFYDCRALSPIRRKSLTSEWFGRSSGTWPSMSRWRSQSPSGFSKHYSWSSVSSEKCPIASNYYVRDDNVDRSDFPSIENYNIPVNMRHVNKTRAKIADKFTSSMYPSASVANEGQRPSVIGMIDRRGVYEQETNFSDDSLDPKEERVKHQIIVKSHVIKENENNDNNNKCPPDVVAHTKKEPIDEINDDFDDAYIELPKAKFAGSNDLKTPIQQFKSMILGAPLLLNCENDTNENVLLNKSRGNKKRVSFGESNIVIEPVSSCDNEDHADSRKSMIKLSPESIERKIWKSSELNKSIADVHVTNEKSISSNIDDYLDEALIFMSNMNSINKYINTDEASDKCQIMRDSNNEIPREFKDLERNSVMKEENLETSMYSPYEKCLRSMEILEECLSRVKCSDEIECNVKNSAEAKLDLANFSSDKNWIDEKVENSNCEDVSITYDNYNIDRYFQKSFGNYDNENDSSNFDLKTLDRYRKLLDNSRCKNSVKKRSRSLTTVRCRDNDLDNSNIYPKFMNNRMDEDALIARVKKSLPTPRCSITKYDSSDESSSSDEALATFIESIDKVSRSKDKFKYPTSPRVKFLQLLSERRRIVENSRSTGAS